MWRPRVDAEVRWLLNALGCHTDRVEDLSEEEFRFILKPRRQLVVTAVHPDKQQGDEKKIRLATEKTKRLNAAWEKILQRIPSTYRTVGQKVSARLTEAALNANVNAWDRGWRVDDFLGREWAEQDSRDAGEAGGNAETGADSASAGDRAGAAETGAAASGSSGPDARNPGEAAGSDDGLCDQAPHCAEFDRKHGGLPTEKQLQYKFLYAAQGHCVACMRAYAQRPGFDKSCISCGKNARQWAQSSVSGRKQKKVVIPADVEDWLRSNDL